MTQKTTPYPTSPTQSWIILKDGSQVSERQFTYTMVALQSLTTNPLELQRLKRIAEDANEEESCGGLFSSIAKDLMSSSERSLKSEEDRNQADLKINALVKKIILNAVKIENTEIIVTDPRQ